LVVQLTDELLELEGVKVGSEEEALAMVKAYKAELDEAREFMNSVQKELIGL
jgi:hypothetical protein